MNPLLKLGTQTPLQMDHMPPVPHEERSAVNYHMFEACWDEENQKPEYVYPSLSGSLSVRTFVVSSALHVAHLCGCACTGALARRSTGRRC